MNFFGKAWVSWTLLATIQWELANAFTSHGTTINHKAFARFEACKLAPQRLAENAEGVVYVNEKVCAI
jgi:hypothetical protein